MTTGQTRVLVLLMVLLALEAVRKTGVSNWIKTAINNGNTALYGRTQQQGGTSSGK